MQDYPNNIIDRIDHFFLRVKAEDFRTKKDVSHDIYIYGHGLMRTVLKLLAAGRYGVHADEFPRDHAARLEQLGAPLLLESRPRRGTGDAPVWATFDPRSNQSFHLGAIVEKAPAS